MENVCEWEVFMNETFPYVCVCMLVYSVLCSEASLRHHMY